MATCGKCSKEVYADGTCSGCLYPADACACLSPQQRAGALKGRGARAPRHAPRADRLPIGLRAGTPLDHRNNNTYVVYGKTDRGRKPHGVIDMRQRIYQAGGELKNFVYWKRRVMSFAEDVWQQIDRGGVDWLEMVDHPKNRVFRLSIDQARKNGEWYQDTFHSIGRRWGVPLGMWAVEEGPVQPPPKGKPLDPPPAAEPAPRLL